MQLDNIDVLIVYKIDKNFKNSFKDFLLKGKFLIFLDDSSNIVCENIKIYKEDDFQKIALDVLGLKTKIIKNPFLNIQKDKFFKIKEKLEEYILGVSLSYSDFSDFKKIHFKNLFLNLLNSKNITLLKSLKNSFKNIPAIVVGAAPSLKKDLLVLKKLQNRALIFSGGTANSVLSKNGIRAHFLASIDKNAPFDIFKKNHFFHIPFIYKNEISFKNLNLVVGDRILTNSNGYFELEKFFEKELNIFQGEFDGGWTVTTFLIAKAYFLGCSPIIFTGMDLSFSKEKYLDISVIKKDEYIKTKDIFSKDVFTKRDWILAKKWVEEFSYNKKIYNANRSGLFFENIEKRSLLDLEKLKDEMDLTSYVHSKLQNCDKVCIDKKKAKSLLKDLKKSAKNCLKIIDDAFLKLEKAYFDKKSFFFISIENEFFYKKQILPLWSMFKNVFEKKNMGNIEKELNRLIFFKNATEEFLDGDI